MDIHQAILDPNKKVTLVTDVMFVNRITFFVRKLRWIKFTTLGYTLKRTKGRLISSLNNIISIYNASGFNIRTALMDQYFYFLILDFLGLNINSTATSEHVPEIERKIQVIKERARSIQINIPFKRTPRIIIIELQKFLVIWINNFLVKSFLSANFRPRNLMTGTTLDCQKHCKTDFGAYCEVHKEKFPLNNINNEQTQSAICLRPTTNFKVSYTFLFLTTGKHITQKQFRVVPVPATVIICMEELVAINTQTDEDLTFEDRYPNPLTNEDTAEPIGVYVNTGVDDERNSDTMAKMETGTGIVIPGVGMR